MSPLIYLVATVLIGLFFFNNVIDFFSTGNGSLFLFFLFFLFPFTSVYSLSLSPTLSLSLSLSLYLILVKLWIYIYIYLYLYIYHFRKTVNLLLYLDAHQIISKPKFTDWMYRRLHNRLSHILDIFWSLSASMWLSFNRSTFDSEILNPLLYPEQHHSDGTWNEHKVLSAR